MPPKQPFIGYGAVSLLPGVLPEEEREPRGVERQQHTAASGRTLHYYVGERNFIEVAFDWQDSTLKAEWLAWWEAVKDGTVFLYCEDDSVPLCGDGTKCGDGSKCGTGTSGDATTTRLVTADQAEFTPEYGQAPARYAVQLRMREYV